MVIFISTWVFLILGTQGGFAEQNSFEQIENKLISTQSVGGTFHQVFFDSLQNKKTYSSGTFAYLQPALMKWLYEEPEPLEIIIGKDKLWVFDPLLENVTIKEVNDITDYQTLASLFQPNQLRHNFMEIVPQQNLLDKDPPMVKFYLRPKKKNKNAAEIQVGFDKEKLYVKQFVIIDANQNYRKISFFNIKLNQSFRESDFHFEITDGVEIIE